MGKLNPRQRTLNCPMISRFVSLVQIQPNVGPHLSLFVKFNQVLPNMVEAQWSFIAYCAAKVNGDCVVVINHIRLLALLRGSNTAVITFPVVRLPSFSIPSVLCLGIHRIHHSH